jgi:hypothetical protein
VQHAHRLPRIDFNARLNEQMNVAHDERRCQRNLCRRQDREEIRQQVQDELMAGGMQLPQQYNQHIIPPLHEVVVPPLHPGGIVPPQQPPHIVENPLNHFAPNPAPVPPHPNHHQQFNIEFHHHQMEQMQVRNDLLQRQAQETFHQQQIQQQLQLQEAERANRQAQNDLVLQEYEAEQVDRHEQDVL